MSVTGSIHIDIIHRLFSGEIGTDELLDTVPRAVETATGQPVLPNLLEEVTDV